MKCTIIFDLDGTLVDSSPGILASLSSAFHETGLKPSRPLTAALIGPPLRDTLVDLCECDEQAPLEQLIDSFKAHYDNIGYLQTHPFSGINDMLHALADKGIPMHIATNKRSVPTEKILRTLGWTTLFNQVLSPDSFTPSLTSKALMLAQLLCDAELNPQHCLYVGDRIDDYHAAQENSLAFGLAEWGFEGDAGVFGESVIRLRQPDLSLIESHLTTGPYS